MTTNRWDDARLDRLADNVSTNTANIAELTKGLGALIQAIEEDRRDIRGLQLEIRRLVEELRQGKN